MLMVSGAHKSQQKEQRSVEPEGRKLRKRSAEHEPDSSSAETDYLSSLFTAARPYIQGTSFTYSILVTLLRAILILNSVFDYGGRIWYGNYEGEDVCRFFCVLGTIYPRRVLSVLRGDSHNAYMVRADGSKIFNLGSIGLPCVPSARTVQELMAVPRPIPQIMTITAEGISIALCQFNAMANPSSFYAVSFDVVHGSSDLDVIVDADRNPVLVGTAIDENLNGPLHMRLHLCLPTLKTVLCL